MGLKMLFAPEMCTETHPTPPPPLNSGVGLGGVSGSWFYATPQQHLRDPPGSIPVRMVLECSNGCCNNHPCLLLGQSSDCRRCHHSFRRRCCHLCHRRHCRDCHHCFFCCCLLLTVVAIAIELLPLLSLSSSHPPLPLPILIDCCLYPSAAITASSSSPARSPRAIQRLLL